MILVNGRIVWLRSCGSRFKKESGLSSRAVSERTYRWAKVKIQHGQSKGAYTKIFQMSYTHWELFLIAEGIEEDKAIGNPKVLDFIVKNSHLYFVPTKVLKAYKMEWYDA